jgi:hypothetical protein
MISKHANVPLNNSQIHISAHIYPPSGVLLCHDDDIEKANGTCRRVAFILYLVEEDWTSDDGGALELYELKDGIWRIPVRILPEFGLFALFRVGEDSLHRVGEVTGTRDRVSIRFILRFLIFSSGWFYGPSDDESCKPCSFTKVIEAPIAASGNHAMLDMINPIYLEEKSIISIRNEFIKSSTIDLEKFLSPNVYAQMVTACCDVGWTFDKAGPPTIAWFASLDSEVSGIIKQVAEMFASTEFSSYIDRITSIPRKEIGVTVRKFENECYTLLNDGDTDTGLDIMYEVVDGELQGGDSVFVFEEETLKRVDRTGNCLRIVLKDDGVCGFVKYVEKKSTGSLYEFRM